MQYPDTNGEAKRTTEWIAHHFRRMVYEMSPQKKKLNTCFWRYALWVHCGDDDNELTTAYTYMSLSTKSRCKNVKKQTVEFHKNKLK